MAKLMIAIALVELPFALVGIGWLTATKLKQKRDQQTQELPRWNDDDHTFI